MRVSAERSLSGIPLLCRRWACPASSLSSSLSSSAAAGSGVDVRLEPRSEGETEAGDRREEDEP